MHAIRHFPERRRHPAPGACLCLSLPASAGPLTCLLPACSVVGFLGSKGGAAGPSAGGASKPAAAAPASTQPTVTRDDLRGRVIVEKNSSADKPAEPAKAKEPKRKKESVDPEDGPPQLLYSGDSDSDPGSDDDSDESSDEDDKGRPPISEAARRGG